MEIVDIINKYSEHLHKALSNYDDEICCENEMTLFQPITYEFDYIKINKKNYENFDEILTMLTVGLITHKKTEERFKKEQIITLIEVMDLMKNNIDMSEKIYDDISDKLSDHFNLAGPLAEIYEIFLEANLDDEDWDDC